MLANGIHITHQESHKEHATNKISSNKSGDQKRAVALDAANCTSLHPGNVVLRSPPVATVLNYNLWNTHCQRCFISEQKLRRCSRCRLVYYCSRDCQRYDWKLCHQRECPILKSLLSLNLHETQFSTILMLGRVSQACTAAAEDCTTSSFPTVNDLVWYEEDTTEEITLLAALASKLNLTNDSYDILHLQKLQSCFRNNNFSITDDLLFEIGSGCFPLGAMVNHSCTPNCVVSYTPKTNQMVLRAITTINQGDEITFSYVDLALPRRERNRHFQQQYHFICKCSRCIEQLSSDCLSARDFGLDMDINNKQEENWTSEQIEKHRQLLQVDDSNDLETREKQLCECLKQQKNELHMFNMNILRTISKLFTLSISLGSIPNAIIYGNEILQHYRRIYPSKHPMIAVHLFTLGDLKSQAQITSDHTQTCSESESGVANWTEALDILQIAYGEDTRLVKLLRERIEHNSGTPQ